MAGSAPRAAVVEGAGTVVAIRSSVLEGQIPFGSAQGKPRFARNDKHTLIPPRRTDPPPPARRRGRAAPNGRRRSVLSPAPRGSAALSAWAAPSARRPGRRGGAPRAAP